MSGIGDSHLDLTLPDEEEHEEIGIQLQGGPMRQTSISFGRFETETLAWERWSSFSQNRYLEEAEKYSKPGSVERKKAFFEEFFKRKALEQQQALAEETRAEYDDSDSDRSEEKDLQENEVSADSSFGYGLRRANSDPDMGRNSVIYDEDQQVFTMTDNVDEGEAAYISESVLQMMAEGAQTFSADSSRSAMQEDKNVAEIEEIHPEPEHCTSLNVSGNNVEENEEVPPEQEHYPMIQVSQKNFKESEEFPPKHEHEHEAEESAELKSAISVSREKLQKPKINADGASTGKVTEGTIRKTSTKSLPSTAKSRQSRLAGSPCPPVVSKTGRLHAKPSRPSVRDPASRANQKLSESMISTKSLPAVDKVSSIKRTTVERKAAKPLSNGFPKHTAVRAEVLAERVSKRPDLSVQDYLRLQKENQAKTKEVLDEKKAREKKEVNANTSVRTRSVRSVSSTGKFENRTTRAGFGFRSDERAEKRKEFYLKLEEKMNAKEAEMNKIQEKTQEEMVAEIKQFRKTLNFKATPIPNFYHEALPRTEGSKISSVLVKSPKPGRKSLGHGPESVSIIQNSRANGCVQEHNAKASPARRKIITSKADQVLAAGMHYTSTKAVKERRLSTSTVKPVKAKSSSTKPEERNAQDRGHTKINTMDLKLNSLENKEGNDNNSHGAHSPISSDVTGDEENRILKDHAATVSEQFNSLENGTDKDRELLDSIVASTSAADGGKSAMKIGQAKDKAVSHKTESLKTKDNISNFSRSHAQKNHHHVPHNTNSSQDSRSKIAKSPRHDHQQVGKPSGNGRHETSKNTPLKKNMKTSPGLSCIVKDIPVA